MNVVRGSAAEIKIEQSGEICNIGHKSNRTITTTPITLKMNNSHLTKTGRARVDQ